MPMKATPAQLLLDAACCLDAVVILLFISHVTVVSAGFTVLAAVFAAFAFIFLLRALNRLTHS